MFLGYIRGEVAVPLAKWETELGHVFVGKQAQGGITQPIDVASARWRYNVTYHGSYENTSVRVRQRSQTL